MDLERDIEIISRQEAALQFTTFTEGDAFAIGQALRDQAASQGQAVAIDIRLSGRPLFFFAMPGTTPDLIEWIRRKSNSCLRWLKSSYAVGRGLAKRGQSMSADRGVDPRDFAPQGGAFPIRLKGSGVIGAITVSGLHERDDHMLVVAVLCEFLDVDFAGLDLGPEEI